MTISERKRSILKAVIDNYIETSEPVGSRAVAEQSRLTLSSATIRNEMSDLEAMGYLEQPHTSAGRIPSPRGYRLYVDELMKRYQLSAAEIQRINQSLRLKIQEMDTIMAEAGRIISQLTDYPSYSLSGSPGCVSAERFDILMVDRASFIIVVLTNLNTIKSRLVRYPVSVGERQIRFVNTLLNMRFSGLSIDEITPDMIRETECDAGPAGGLVSLAVSFAIDVLGDCGNQPVCLSGASCIFDHPEFHDIAKARRLLSFLSGEKEDARLPVPDDCNQIKILIGPENTAEELRDSSVVVASYDIGGNMKGLIGVVGPTRMDYAKVSSCLAYFTKGLSRFIAGGMCFAPDADDI